MGSTLNGSGTLDAYGGMAIDTTESITHLSGVTLNNHGTATWTGLHSGGIYASNGATINNLAGATFNAQVDGRLTWDPAQAGGPAPPVFNNAGSFIRSGDTNQTDINIPFNNTGSVDVQAGFLHLGESDYPIVSTSTGSFTGAAGTTLYLTAENLTASSSIAGDTVSSGRRDRCRQLSGGQRHRRQRRHLHRPDPRGGQRARHLWHGQLQPLLRRPGDPDDRHADGPDNGGTLTGTDSFVVNGMFTWACSTLDGPFAIDAYGGHDV